MLDPRISEEFLNTFAGKLIGEGMSRKVFDLPLMPGFVVKIEEDQQRFQNVIEWETWGTVDECDAGKWFAPVKHISPNGRVLVMAKTTPIAPGDYPKMVPAFFTDLKYRNFGQYKGRLVCHDYGLASVLMTNGLTKRMKRAHWYEG